MVAAPVRRPTMAAASRVLCSLLLFAVASQVCFCHSLHALFSLSSFSVPERVQHPVRACECVTALVNAGIYNPLITFLRPRIRPCMCHLIHKYPGTRKCNGTSSLEKGF
eukprot:3233089-Rhodomonas_salina.2